MPDAGSMSRRPPLPLRGSVLGFDFGLARIGVAVGELETRQASPLLTIREKSGAARLAAIGKLLAEWRPAALVVGVPRRLDGSDSELTPRCRRFADQLRGRFELRVLECDERLTSVAADMALKDSGQRDWRVRRNVLDAVAAQLILQHFLDTGLHEES